jgi:hypothetical protein
VGFINEHRGEYGVEPICEVLPIAPSTYFEHRRRQLRPETRPARAKRDDELRPLIRNIWEENYSVYGVRKVWNALKKDQQVARCTVARLMREEGLEGAVRGRAFKRTTVAGEKTDCPPDLVNREFEATALPISSGSPTSPTSRPGQGSSTSPSSSTSSRAGSSAGRSPPAWQPTWCWTHWSKPSTSAQ